MTYLFTRKPIVIILIIAAVLLIGNLVANTSETKSANAQKTQPIELQPEHQELVKQLPVPNIGLPSKNNPKPLIYAKSYILIDDQSKYPLMAKNADTPVAIASTTKIMTTLVALDSYPDLDQVVTVTNKAATITGSEIQLLTGEKMTARNLLYALMINSANDSAYALAEGTGSLEDFVTKMNEKAKILGLKNTHYKDPAGLDDEGRSTPRDLALLMQYALTNKSFQSFVAPAKHTIWSADEKYKHDLQNSNRLIDPEQPLYLPNAIGGKTGFTFEAGHCLVAAAKGNDGKNYVAVILNTNEATKEASAKEARKLLVWATQ